MSFQSLNTVLGSVQRHYARRDRQQFQMVTRAWVDIVGAVVAAQTRPVSIYRDILKVATSSAAWAQNLVFERQRILAKLNQQLSLDLVDIRFTPAQWHRQPTSTFAGEQEQIELWQSHPSRLSSPPVEKVPESPEPDDAIAAFGRWQAIMRSRSHRLPLCSECQCPTPTGELQRWGMCSLCAAKRW